MNRNDVINLNNNKKFVNSVAKLYGVNNGLEYQIDRYQSIYETHKHTYGEDAMFFSSPGRIEVCGNHTDHNNGKVLCASISVDTVACVSANDINIITIDSIGYPAVTVDITDLTKRPNEIASSEALVRGVCKFFIDNGLKIGGFYATTSSDVFKGAGVSSSACFEVLVCEILNVLYNKSSIDKMTKAKASHYAESVYFGKPCGLMDQSAIALGGVSYIDFKDTQKPIVETIPWNFNDLEIVLVNCGGDHCNLTDEYASIRREMEGVADLFGQQKLRFVNKNDFYSSIPAIQEKTTGRAILRAMHFFDENERVVDCASAIKNVNKDAFNKNILDSGNSSYKLLQNCYPMGDTMQRIPLALAVSSKDENVLSYRVHGGGFMGTMISYVKAEGTDKYLKKMIDIFGKDNVFRISVRNDGTCLVEM